MDVALDIVPMAAGRGGTGSGIWTYTVNLLRHLDACCPADLDVGVLMRRGQLAELGFPLTRLKPVEVAWPGKGIVSRLLWVHLALPLVCLRKRITVLHKLATDTPWWCPAQRITTIHDFYYEFLLEHTPREQVRLYERLEQIYFEWVTRICFRRSRALLTVSAAVRDEAARRYPAASSKLTVIHHGAPSAAVGAQWPTGGHQDLHNSQFAIPKASFTFVYVAKFMTHKGQFDALRAVERLAELRPELARRVRLQFRGFSNDRAYAAELRAAIARSPLAQQVEMLDYRAGLGVPDIYRGATAALLLSQYEGFGFPVVEAQSQGVPVICSDLPVLREVAGDAALFVDAADPDAVATALIKLLDDPGCVRSLREKGLANLQRFTWAEAARRTLSVYQQVLAGSSA